MRVRLFLARAVMTSFVSNAALATGKAYAFIEDGGDHPASECLEIEFPGDIDSADESGLLKTTLIESSEDNEAGIDVFQHAYNTLQNCQKAAKKSDQDNGISD